MRHFITKYYYAQVFKKKYFSKSYWKSQDILVFIINILAVSPVLTYIWHFLTILLSYNLNLPPKKSLTWTSNLETLIFFILAKLACFCNSKIIIFLAKLPILHKKEGNTKNWGPFPPLSGQKFLERYNEIYIKFKKM